MQLSADRNSTPPLMEQSWQCALGSTIFQIRVKRFNGRQSISEALIALAPFATRFHMVRHDHLMEQPMLGI